MIPVVGVGIACQGEIADGDAAAQTERAVSEGIGGGTGVDGCEQVVGIGIACGLGGGCSYIHFCPGKAVHTVVAVLCALGIGISGVFCPQKQTCVFVIAVGGGLAQGVRYGSRQIAVGCVGCCALDAAGCAGDGYSGIVAVGIVGKAVGHAGGAGGCFHIVISVVGVGQRHAGGQHSFGKVVGGVFARQRTVPCLSYLHKIRLKNTQHLQEYTAIVVSICIYIGVLDI